MSSFHANSGNAFENIEAESGGVSGLELGTEEFMVVFRLRCAMEGSVVADVERAMATFGRLFLDPHPKTDNIPAVSVSFDSSTLVR